MTTKTPTIEKILAEALELHEKGVSLHSIVRTYPEHKEEIESLFGTLGTLSLEKEKIRVPAEGLERLLASLPETEAPVAQKASVKSPWSVFVSSIQLSSLKFVLPIAALALLTGGLVLHKDASAPSALAPTNVASNGSPTETPADKEVAIAPAASPAAKVAVPGTAAPMMMAASAPATGGTATDRMVASFSQEADTEATIAKQDDESTNTAASSDQANATNPTTAYEN